MSGVVSLNWNNHRLFRFVWRASNLLLAASLLFAAYAIAREFSVRWYLDGFSDAVVPVAATPEQKVQYILDWMRTGPPRAVAADPRGLALRDPETTLNYQQLLSVCGTATNAFLNLARSSGLQTRRLLLLTPQRTTKHVVAEVLIEDRWIIVDPTFRIIMRDAQDRMLTRSDLKDPVLFAQVTGKIPDYPKEYNYQSFAHVRLARLPLEGFHVRRLLDSVYPRWEEAIDWSLLLERESFLALCLSLLVNALLLVWRFSLGWYADHRLKIPRVRLRQKTARAGAAFLSTPEIK